MTWDARRCIGVDPGLFYDPMRTDAALAVCAGCGCAPECLEREMAESYKPGAIHGVRAGMTEGERRRLFRWRYPDLRARSHAGAHYYDLIPA